MRTNSSKSAGVSGLRNNNGAARNGAIDHLEAVRRGTGLTMIASAMRTITDNDLRATLALIAQSIPTEAYADHGSTIARMLFHSDTSANARRVQDDLLRKLSPEEKLQMVRDLTIGVQKVAFAGLRQRNPHLTDDEIWIELAIRRLGVDVVRKIYGAEKPRK